MRSWLARIGGGAADRAQRARGRRTRDGLRRGWLEPLEARRLLAVFTVDAGGGGTHTTIQAALDAAAAADDGDDLIEIVDDTYVETLTIANSANLQNLVLRSQSGNAGAVIIQAAAATDAVITVSDDAVTIQSLTVTGGTIGISAVAVDGLVLRDVRAIDMTTAADQGTGFNGINLEGTTTIEGGQFTGNDRGIVLDGNAGLGSVLVITTFGGAGTNASNNNNVGVSLRQFTGGVTINGAAINSNDASGAATGAGLIIENLGGGGVTLEGVTGNLNRLGATLANLGTLTITDCTFSSNLEGGIQLSAITGSVTLTNVTADNNDADDDGTGDGLAAFNDGATPAIAGDLVVRGSRFRAIGGGAADRQMNGIFVASLGPVSNVLLENNGGTANEVSGNLRAGVLLNAILPGAGHGLNVTISGGTFNNNGTQAAQASHNGVGIFHFEGTITISGATATGNANDGFELNNLGGDVQITGVTAGGNGAAGMLVTGAGNVSLAQSTVSGNADHGVVLVDTLGDVTATGLVANNNDNDNDGVGSGLAILIANAATALAGNLTVRGSQLRDTQGANDHQEFGLQVQSLAAGSVVVLENDGGTSNDISGNETDGVTLGPGGASLTITGGAFNNNLNRGLFAAAIGAVNISGATFNGNNLGAVFNEADSVVLDGVTASQNNDDGLRFIDVAGDVTISNVTADDNDRDNDGTGNGMSFLRNAAPAAIGGNLLVRGSRFRDSGGANDHQVHGLFVDSLADAATATIEDLAGTETIASGNEMDGIALRGGASITVRNTTFSGNAGRGLFINTAGLLHLAGVTATTNNVGVFVNPVGSVIVENSTFSENNDGGLALFDVAGDVTLTDVVADNNDRDNDAVGNGISIDEAAAAVALAGNLVVEGVRARDTLGANDHQEAGLLVSSMSAISNAVFRPSAAHQNNFSGNENSGVFIDVGGANLSIFGGIFNNNGTGVAANAGTGFLARGFRGQVLVTGLVAAGNNGVGFDLQNTSTTTVLIGDLVQLIGNTEAGGIVNVAQSLVVTPTTPDANDILAINAQGYRHHRNGQIFDQVQVSNVVTRTFNALGGTDFFHLAATPAGTVTFLNGGEGDDFFFISSDAAPTTATPVGTLNNVLGLVNIDGGPGFELLHMSDQGDAAANAGGLVDNSVTGLGLGAAVTFSGIDLMVLSLGSGGDSFSVTNLSVFTTINGNGGNDTISVNAARITPDGQPAHSAIAAPLVFNGGLGSDNLQVVFTDASGANDGSDQALVTDAAVYSGFTFLLHSGLETITLSMLSGDDIAYVHHRNATDRLPATIIVDGGPGRDRLWVDGTSENDIIIATAVAGGGRYQVTGIEALYLYGYNGDDVIRNLSDVHSLIEGGLGDDFLEGSSGIDVIFGSKGRDTVLGGAGNDYLFPDHDQARNNYFDSLELVDGSLGTDVAIALNFDTVTGVETLLNINNAAVMKFLLDQALTAPVFQ